MFWLLFWALVTFATALAVLLYCYPQPFFSAAIAGERRAAGLVERSLDADGHQIHYLDSGDNNGSECLLLLHGFGANKDNWVRVAKYLRSEFRIIAPDLPGFGESSYRQTAAYGVDDQVQYLQAFVGGLGLEKLHLGGNSMGGQIAVVYAATYPDQVQSLWLLAPAGVETAQASELMERIQGGQNLLVPRSRAEFRALMQQVFVKPPFAPAPFVSCLADRAISEQPARAKIFADWLATPRPLEGVFADIGAPTFLVWGDHDRLLHVSGAEVLKKIRQTTTVAIMANVGHCPMLERPRETAEAYLRFCRGAATQRS